MFFWRYIRSTPCPCWWLIGVLASLALSCGPKQADFACTAGLVDVDHTHGANSVLCGRLWTRFCPKVCRLCLLTLSVLNGTLVSFLQFQNHSVSITYSSVGNDLHAGKHSRCDDHHSCIKTWLASWKGNAHMEKMTSVIVIPEAYYTLTITVIIPNVDLSITQSQTRIDGSANLQTQLRASQWMRALSFAHFLSISFSASNAKQPFCSGLQTCKTLYAPPLPLHFLLIKEPWPRLVSFRCCLWICSSPSPLQFPNRFH